MKSVMIAKSACCVAIALLALNCPELGAQESVGKSSDASQLPAAGVKKIVDTVHEKMPGTKVLLLGVFPRGGKADDPRRLKLAEINKIISTFGDGSKTRYLDITKAFLEPDGTLTKEVMHDYLHPTERGYEIWYEQMKPVLDEMMK